MIKFNKKESFLPQYVRLCISVSIYLNIFSLWRNSDYLKRYFFQMCVLKHFFFQSDLKKCYEFCIKRLRFKHNTESDFHHVIDFGNIQ